jgi:hypothetical protein
MTDGFYPAVGYWGDFTFNFGQRAFEYTVPTGYKALNTSNLPEPDIADGSDYFNTVLYTGDGTTSNTISGLSFQPDWVWTKSRSEGYRHNVYDAVRGFDKYLEPSFTNAENTDGTSAGTAVFLGVTSTGFTVGVPTSGTYNGNLGTNENNGTYVAWNWLAGNGTSSNTAGSITSTVSANPTAGFSIVSFNSGASGAKTVGHGLGVAPQLIITKDRDNATNWTTYHASATTATDKYLNLNGTAAVQTASGIWGSTLPTSTVFGFGSGTASAPNADCIAYCFAEVESYSRIGSYVGNGSSDGPFVYCGFKPAWLLIKRTDSSSDWILQDNKRLGYNVDNNDLIPNQSYAEATDDRLDQLSNGFKLRSTFTTSNASGSTYIFIALAENPFGGSGVSPATAR